MQPSPKHIVLISIDTLRGDCVGVNKYQYLPKELQGKFAQSTNYLDKLAERGAHFAKCFSAAPYTTASHASTFTGYFPLHHGLFEYYNAEIKRQTIFEAGKEAKRKTAFQTDFPLILGDVLGFTRGVDAYFVEDEYAALADLKRSLSQSTLSFFHFGGVHYPYGFHKLRFGGQDYKDKVVQLEREEGLDGSVLPVDQFDETHRDGEDKELLFRYKKIIEKLYTDGNYEKLTKLYIDGIDYFVEQRFRPFMEELLATIDLSESVVFIFGDHGEEWSPSSEGHYKTLSYGVLNVPLLVLGQDIPACVVDDMVRTVDIGATVLAMLRGTAAPGLDGVCLDLKRPERVTPGLVAYAQTWLGIGKDALLKHMERALADGKVKKDITTVKRGESVIRNGLQLLRLYSKESRKTFDELLSYGFGQPAMSEYEALSSMLATYNASKPKAQAPQLTPDDEIKEQLRLLGYKL